MESLEPEINESRPIIDTIRDINQVAIFVVVVVFGFITGLRVLSDFFPGGGHRSGVAVLTDKDAAGSSKGSSINYQRFFITKLRDTHVFGISSKLIDLERRHASSLERSGAVRDELRGRYYGFSSETNFVFVGPKGVGHVLFEQDVMVNRYDLSRERKVGPPGTEQTQLNRNLYLVTIADTNRDGFLTLEDEQTLYVSDYDGKNLKPLLNNVASYQEMGANTFMITQLRGTTQHFIEYDVVKDTLLEVKLPEI